MSQQGQGLLELEEDIPKSGRCATIRKAFKAIADVWIHSKNNIGTIMAHPEYEQFRKPVRKLFIGKILILLISLGVELATSFPLRLIMTALGDMDTEAFYEAFQVYLAFALISSPLRSLDKYWTELLHLKFREACSKVLLHIYHDDCMFYHLLRDEKLDNPGLRLEQDVGDWSTGIIGFSFYLLREFLRMFGWAAILLTIGNFLILYVFLFASGLVVGSVVVFGSKMTELSFLIKRDEMDFRAGIMRTRDNAEAIAAYGAAEFEENWSYYRLLVLLHDIKLFVQWESILEFLRNITKHAALILPFLLSAKDYFRGDIKLGIIMQSSQAFKELLMSLTIIVNKMALISRLQAGGRRVSEVIDSVQTMHKKVNFPKIENSLVSTRNHMTPLNSSRYLQSAIDKKDNTNANDAMSGQNITNINDHTKTNNSNNNNGLRDVYWQKSISERKAVQYNGIEFLYIQDIKSCDTYLKVENLSVIVPMSKTLLLHNLSFQVEAGNSLLIVGPSGAGKSSLMRVLSSLWKWGKGEIQRLDNRYSMFLPQKPYLPKLPENQNTLENQLLFPSYNEAREQQTKPNNEASDTTQESKNEDESMQNEFEPTQTHLTQENICMLLRDLNLSYILNYVSAATENGTIESVDNNHELSNTDGDLIACADLQRSTDWSSLLSLGEQQRLAFGRVLVKKPHLVFLDEATSALDEDNQTEMYKLLKQTGATFVSIGHRPNLHEHHTHVLWMAGDSTWRFMTSEEYARNMAELPTDCHDNEKSE